MTRIGEPIREVEDVPRPIRVPTIQPRREPMVPFTLPEREPVPVRRIPVPVRREAVPVGLGSIPGTAYTVSEIPYQCPRCGDRLALEDHHDLETLFVCPKHGVVGRF